MRGGSGKAAPRAGVAARGARVDPGRSRARAEPGGGLRRVLLFGGFLVAALLIYAPALDGEFISDDEHYVRNNVYVHDPVDNWIAIVDPTSVLAVVVENYAPVHVLLHALEWQVFGPSVRGYHVVNVCLHAAAAFLLVALFRRSGIAALPAALGGAFFLVHPANVEAVAWINQLKTSSAMVLCLGALLLHPRRPGAGALLFALSLLAKPTAAVALFAAAAFGWVRAGRGAAGAPAEGWRWGWLVGWAGILGLFAIAELAAFGQTAGQAAPLYPELDTRLRSILAIGLRYLVMSATSFGLSAFHEPPAADTWSDPWWLASLVAFGLLAWRAAVVVRARREEAVYWIWAAISFGPICGLIPLPFPMADRYLYFILPGLIGGVLLAGSQVSDRLAVGSGRPLASRLRQGGAIVAAVWIAFFAWRSFDRAHVWKSPYTVMADVEQNYPEGTAAKTRRATRAAAVGDAATAVALLRAAHERGYNRLDHLLVGTYVQIQDAPAFVALKQEWAREWIERLERSGSRSQIELRLVAQAHVVLEDLPAARDAIVAAIELGGPITEDLKHDLAEIERAIRFSKLREP